MHLPSFFHLTSCGPDSYLQLVAGSEGRQTLVLTKAKRDATVFTTKTSPKWDLPLAPGRTVRPGEEDKIVYEGDAAVEWFPDFLAKADHGADGNYRFAGMLTGHVQERREQIERNRYFKEDVAEMRGRAVGDGRLWKSVPWLDPAARRRVHWHPFLPIIGFEAPAVAGAHISPSGGGLEAAFDCLTVADPAPGSVPGSVPVSMGSVEAALQSMREVLGRMQLRNSKGTFHRAPAGCEVVLDLLATRGQRQRGHQLGCTRDGNQTTTGIPGYGTAVFPHSAAWDGVVGYLWLSPVCFYTCPGWEGREAEWQAWRRNFELHGEKYAVPS